MRENNAFSVNDRQKILRYGAPVGCHIEEHQRLDRCMVRLRALINEAEGRGQSLASGTVVIADALTGSNGRFTRYWHAPPGGLWMALVWADTLLPAFSRLLPLAIGIACCETVRFYTADVAVRWVNDVHIQGRKLAGILSETMISPAGERYHLLGIGVNVNNTDFPRELRETAVSLAAHLGHQVDRKEILARLLTRLTWNIGLLHYEEEQALAAVEGAQTEGQASGLLSTYRHYCDTVGKRVLYGYNVQEKPFYSALVTAVDAAGGLRMQLDDGSVITESSGEVLYL